ncbi:hypothetical protein GALMADRAFT_211778 [Galerina marginata CBS 339.88]|uniref:Uncharacterized protein n=1 Tax=Galerina marginata (strain CBS 339.88) TaxID=685588 RepID=A0A067SVA9_GALM3|nr:hypothetical protein GALMADRAFT_211778 [Galerina marginata CBS 339.88]
MTKLRDRERKRMMNRRLRVRGDVAWAGGFWTGGLLRFVRVANACGWRLASTKWLLGWLWAELAASQVEVVAESGREARCEHTRTTITLSRDGRDKRKRRRPQKRRGRYRTGRERKLQVENMMTLSSRGFMADKKAAGVEFEVEGMWEEAAGGRPHP